MKKIMFLNTVLILSMMGLAGCDNKTSSNMTANVNMANGSMANMNANSNTAVVVNNNMANSNMMMANSNMTGSVEGNSADFMKKAAEGGMAEVKMGEIAASKAQMPELKAFGQKMVTDHSKANDDLKAVAAKKNATLPTAVSDEQKEGIDKLSKLSGADFDKEYVKMMVDDHEKDVADFQKQADSGSDADIKAFAARTLPVLKSHLEIIKTIQGKMK